MSHVRLTENVYLNADKTQVVEEGSEEAAFHYGAPGQLVPQKEAERLGISGNQIAGDEAKDVIHIEVESPNNLPGSLRVEGAGKATIPVTQADRAAVELGDRQLVSGKDRRRTEGEALLEGDLKPLEGQTVVGQTGSQKQVAKEQPGTVKAPAAVPPGGEKGQQAGGNKMTEQKQNK